MRYFQRVASAAVAAGALSLGGCSDWLVVENPGVIDAGALDPVADADLLARSAQQNFASAYGNLIVYSSWFVGETDVSDTFTTRNEYGRRQVTSHNASHDSDVWFPLSQAASSAYLVLRTKLPNAAASIHYARANLFLGYSYVFMAEQFCAGTVLSGPELTTVAMLDSAVTHFALALSRGTAAGGEGLDLANAARVGTARAHLQAGRAAQAIAAADAVPVGYTYRLGYADDLAERFRLANRMFFYVRDRGSIAVAPIWRTTDPRVPWLVTTAFSPQDAGYTNDRGVPYAVQQKYPAYNTPVRLASRLEADYIKAEAEGTAAQLALIAARRAANNRPAYGGAVDASSVRTEFFTQRGLDFYLEGKRMGDFRRHPTNIIGVPVPGTAYWKSGFAPVGNDTCYPFPIRESDNNPNL